MGQTSKIVANSTVPKSIGVTCHMIHFTDLKDFCRAFHHLIYLKQYYTKPLPSFFIDFLIQTVSQKATGLSNLYWKYTQLLRFVEINTVAKHHCVPFRTMYSFYCKLKYFDYDCLIFIASLLPIVRYHCHALLYYLHWLHL